MFNSLIESFALKAGAVKSIYDFQTRESRRKMVRGFGFTFVALALVVQIFAFGSTPKSQAAASPNDLIPGGVNSKAALVSKCNSNYHQIKTIYAWYGVSCKDINNGVFKDLKSTEYDGTLYSVGHLPYNLPNSNETPVTVAGGTLYWRKLHSWDTGQYSTYQATKVTADNGKVFFILWPCGNLVSIGLPQHYAPPKPKPKPTPTPKPAPKPTPKPTPPPQLCQYNSSLPSTSPLCKPCTSSATQYDTLSCLSYGKSASNLTQNIANANGSTAKAGDMVEYTLTVTNNSAAVAKAFVVRENIGDVLDYANTLNLTGGSLASSDMLSWPATDIPAHGSIQKKFTVQVKDPVPSTAPAADDPQGFNSIMTNVYGNTVNINVAQPVVLTAAKTATTALPNTGPGTGVIVMGIFAILAGYFYFRSRLLVKESQVMQMMALQEGATNNG